MALVNGKEQRLFTSYQESKSGNESAPQTYKNTTARFEMHGDMALPQPSYMIEFDKGKLGGKEHGTASDLMSIGTNFSYTMAQRLSEFLFWLSYGMGKADNVVTVDTGVYNHSFKLPAISSLTLPTFTMEHGNGTTNDCLAGCVVNDFSVTIPMNSGNGIWETTFNGWANKHYPNSGTLTKLSSGSMSSASESLTTEPIMNGKCCQVWVAGSLESDFGQTSVDFTGDDLPVTKSTLTTLINSITFSVNHGMSMEDKMRAGGCGIVNDWTRNTPAVTLAINLRKDVSIFDFNSFALNDYPISLELLYQGPVLSGAYRYAFDLFFTNLRVMSITEDRETSINQDVTFEVLGDSNNDAIIAYAQTGIDEGYNAVAP